MEENIERQFEEQKKLFKQLDVELDALTIHQKDFATKFRGYDPDEVDTFLDTVIKDYGQFFVIINDLLNQYEKVQHQARANYEALQHKKVEEVEFNPPAEKRPEIDKKFIEDVVKQLEHNIDELKYRIQVGFDSERD
ncbi:DivIVA domain-containing protein [Paenibacillus profundus]|uniref:DivIVA domain-containing protein n=1 Tax=Paenibacillus profundus TaxID=1173085 RepID=A0ABS8YD34_9BACL|nr:MULTISPECIES: DivIVA domain-containing protein [Paenibacillus]MCE5169925.1 DivIVA domain-containing protein [Paenibacillus profundus]